MIPPLLTLCGACDDCCCFSTNREEAFRAFGSTLAICIRYLPKTCTTTITIAFRLDVSVSLFRHRHNLLLFRNLASAPFIASHTVVAITAIV